MPCSSVQGIVEAPISVYQKVPVARLHESNWEWPPVSPYVDVADLPLSGRPPCCGGVLCDAPQAYFRHNTFGIFLVARYLPTTASLSYVCVLHPTVVVLFFVDKPVHP